MSSAWRSIPPLALLLPLLVPLLPGQDERPSRRRVREGEVFEDALRRRGEDREHAKLAPATPLPEADRIRRAPFALERRDGRILLGAVEWQPDFGDRIALFDGEPGPADRSRRLVHDHPAEIVRPVAVLDREGRTRIFWTELVDGAAQLRAATELADGRFAPPVTLTRGPLPNSNVEAALHADGRIYLVFETETTDADDRRGSRDVVLAPLVGDELGPAIAIGDGPHGDLDASIVSAGGRLWIAWIAWTGRDYEVLLRSFDPRAGATTNGSPAAGALSEVLSVSADPRSDDLHATLAVAPDGALWLAWDRVQNPLRGEAAPAVLRPDFAGPSQIAVDVRVACVRDGRVLVPRSEGAADGVVPGAPLLSTGGGRPRLAFDAAGRLWIAYRKLHRFGSARADFHFPLLVQHLDGRRWSEPLASDAVLNVPEAPALVRAGAGVLAAFARDPGSIVVAAVSAPASPAPIELVEPPPVELPLARPGGAVLDDPLVTGARHFEVTRGEQRWRVFWGDLHRHSSVSRCMAGAEPGPDDRWRWARDVHRLDFMALTDHQPLDATTAWQLDKMLWLHQSPRFVTLAGIEWSSPDEGHHNVIFRERSFPLASTAASIPALYQSLRKGDCFTIPHHTSDFHFPNDFSRVDDRFTRLIEIYQACRGNFELDGGFRQALAATTVGCFVQDALNEGHRFGIIASTDHGFGQSYACVLAESLDRRSVFEALLARRTYGATTKGMLVDLRVDEAVMGEELLVREPPRVRLQVRGAAELADVVVFRNGRRWKSARPLEPRIANRFAPLRLLVRLPPRASPPERDWTLRVRAPPARLRVLEDQRVYSARGPTPSWSLTAEGARFTWPSGFSPQAAEVDHWVHLRPLGGANATLDVATGAEPLRFTIEELLAQPRRIEADGLACTLAIAPGDAAIDLEQGLGAREFAAEWEDDKLPRGDSWYYARVIQTDGEMAWSSPIFVTSQRR